MSDPITKRLDALEAVNRRLAEEVLELREQLAATHLGGFRSIRDSRRCPACGSGSLIHVRHAHETGPGWPVELGLTHEKSMWKGSIIHGPMETFACRACGLVEYHVIDFSGVVADGDEVIAIEPEPGPPRSGPFR